jgi:sugar O-acyltransferase (sialic acid O-acetyltransferase NeuD family)
MYLYGASGHAKVIMDILSAMGVEVECLVDDNQEVDQLCGYPVVHESAGLSPIIISIGSNYARKKIASELRAVFGKAIHPSAIISPTSKIGEGTVIMQGTVVQAETTVGNHCIINTGASIDHECVLENFVHVSPHATLCGNVHVGEGTWVGAGSTVIQGVKIGKWCVVGAGTVVAKDIPDGVLAVGNRMLRIKELSDEILSKLHMGGGKLS